jgi:hypothetical protein
MMAIKQLWLCSNHLYGESTELQLHSPEVAAAKPCEGRDQAGVKAIVLPAGSATLRGLPALADIR